jgi:hypothetical protein
MTLEDRRQARHRRRGPRRQEARRQGAVRRAHRRRRPGRRGRGVYAARKGIRTGVAAERFGGQVNDTLGIENYISVLETDGPKFAAALEARQGLRRRHHEPAARREADPGRQPAA